MEMEMNYWEWEGMGLNKTIPLISSDHYDNDSQ